MVNTNEAKVCAANEIIFALDKDKSLAFRKRIRGDTLRTGQ